MKLIGIQKSSYVSKTTNENVQFYNLAFAPASSADTIGVMATVYQADRKCVDSICRLGYGGELKNMINDNFTFKLDKYRRIVALYLGDE